MYNTYIIAVESTPTREKEAEKTRILVQTMTSIILIGLPICIFPLRSQFPIISIHLLSHSKDEHE